MRFSRYLGASFVKKALSFFIFFGIFVNGVYAVDYTGNLPSNITLAGGTSQTSKATAICNKNDCTFGSGSFSYTTSGSGVSNLILNATLPTSVPSSAETTIKFYVNSATINPNSNLILNNFNSILLENTIRINNASLTFNADTTSTTSSFQIGTSASVTLTNNATLNVISNGFLNQNKVTVSNSTLVITGNDIRSYNEMTNNSGTITINGNFYNVGQKQVGLDSPSSVANLTNNGGTITITGSVLNGGQLYSNILCQVGFCGGGNLIINGGSVKVSGQLISQQMDGQASTIKIYGGTLEVGNTLYNKQGSTLIFGLLNGTMGVLKGSLNNQNGVVKVDIKGVSGAGTYKIITGSVTGLNDSEVVFFNNPNPTFLTATYSNGSVSITQTGGGSPPSPSPDPTPSPDTPSKFDEYKNTLNANEKGILGSLSAKFGGDFPLLTNVANVEAAIDDTNKAIKDSVIASPKGMINAFKGDTLLAPFGKGFETKRLAATELIRFDNGRRVKAIQAKPSRDFYLSPVGAVLKANDTSGYVAGFTLGTNYKMQNFTNRVYLSYAYGAARQDLATQSTDTKAHLFQIGTMSRYKLDILETDINANFLLGDFKINNEWQEALLSSTSKFANYQLGFGLTAGARLGERLSIKPFAGIQNYLEMQEGFISVLGFESKSYNAYILDGILGVEGHYKFNEFASVYGKFSFESRLYNSHKHLFLRVGSNELEYENKGYDNAINAHLGTQILTYGRFKLDIEGLFRHYNTGLNYYGGSLIFRYGV